MTDATRILAQIESGDSMAAQRLFPLVYKELRKLASAKLAHEKPGQTLQATALVHDVYLRLVGKEVPQKWETRAHFLGAAAEAMRRILVERARRKGRLRHGGGRRREHPDLDTLHSQAAEEDILALHEALHRFADQDPLKAKLVELRFFAGLTLEEAAACLGISLSTADRAWRYARAWLYSAMADSDSQKK